MNYSDAYITQNVSLEKYHFQLPLTPSPCSFFLSSLLVSDEFHVRLNIEAGAPSPIITRLPGRCQQQNDASISSLDHPEREDDPAPSVFFLSEYRFLAMLFFSSLSHWWSHAAVIPQQRSQYSLSAGTDPLHYTLLNSSEQRAPTHLFLFSEYLCHKSQVIIIKNVYVMYLC